MAEPAVNVVNSAKKTKLGYAAALAGPFTNVGNVVGEINLPEISQAVSKPQANDEAVPGLIIDPAKNIGDVEVTVKTPTVAAFNTLQTQQGLAQYWQFELEHGDKYPFYGCLHTIQSVAGNDKGGCTAKLKFAFAFANTPVAAV